MGQRTLFSYGRLIQVGLALVVTWFLWNTPVVYPIRILVTFLHEISHGLAAVLTGGGIDRITIDPDGSGLCWTRGGWRIAVLPAGYLGSMLLGSLILILACRTRFDKVISAIIGVALVAICLVYVRSVFGFWFGLLIGLSLTAAGVWLSEGINDFLLVFIGSASCLYALFDLQYLWKIKGHGHNDAQMFSREILPLPPTVWVVLWAILAILCLWGALVISLRERRIPQRAG
jgi:hypothetical protein